MINAQNTKFVGITPPAAIVDNAAFTTAAVDTLGWDYATFYVYLGAMDIAMAVLKLTESDNSNMSSGTDILTYGTTANIAGSTSALPVDTEDNKLYMFEVSLKGRKRYMDVGATGGDGTAGTYLTAFCLLSRGETTPVTAAERGAADILRL